MKLYLHEINGFNAKDYKITTKELEVEEKEKTYCYQDKFSNKRVSKTNIGKLDGSYTPYMYTLTPDTMPFINALLERKEMAIESTKQRLTKLEAEKIFLLAQQKKALAEGGEE